MKILLLLVGFIVSLLSIGASEGFAISEDDMMHSTAKIRENTRTAERITEFVNECTSRLGGGDTSLVSTCDSLLQKHNIQMGKFLAENQATIEEIIYPYTIPSNSQTFLGLNSSTVIGSDDQADLGEHALVGRSLLKVTSKMSYECASKAESYDMSGVETCLFVVDSLNSHLREFNQNAKPEFERVLGMAGP